jgi:uncharacterized phiE125 gp8 family phage protein
MGYKSLYSTQSQAEREAEGLELEVVTEPSIEPVSLEDVKLYCKIDIADEDDLLRSLITAARKEAERYSNQSFVEQTLRAQWEIMRDYCILPRPPHQVPIVSVESYDGDAWVSLGSDEYDVLGSKRLKIRVGSAYFGSSYAEQPFRVEYVAGVAASGSTEDIDDRVKTAIKEMVLVAYENRGQSKTEDGGTLEGMLTPMAKQLLDGLSDYS